MAGFCVLALALDSYDDTKPLLAAILFFSGPFYWGFINFVAGVALIPWFLAGVIRFRDSPWVAGLLAGIGTLTIFFCHIVAAVLFIGFLGCFDLVSLIQSRQGSARQGSARQGLGRRLLNGTPSLVAVLALLLLLFRSPTGADLGGAGVEYVGSGSPSAFVYWKVSLFLRAVTEGGGIPSAIVTVLGVGVFAALTMLGARLTMNAAAILAIAGLLAVTMLAPERLGSGSFVDYRLALIPLIVLAMAVGCRWRWPILGATAFAVVLALVLARSAFALKQWPEAGRVYQTFEGATAALPPGSVLLTAWGRPPKQIGWKQWWSPAVGNISTLAVAHGIFVPTVFALAAQQPLALRQEYRGWSVALDLTDTARIVSAFERLRPFCALQAQHVFVAILFSEKPLNPLIRQAPVLFQDERTRLVDICPAVQDARRG